jgi:7-cyano-7-deazaguanine reductase
MDNNQNTVIEIAGKHLGKVGGEGYKSTYAPELLVAVPRYYNRESYGIKEGDLPFVGGDVWNAYEVSAITENGRPVNGMMKIYCPADSPAHVESKSIKLYLNSFNMTRLGTTAQECISLVEQMVAKDLSELLQTEAEAKFFTNEFSPEVEFGADFIRLDSVVDLDEEIFDTFHSDASQLKVSATGLENTRVTTKVTSNLLRSNCRVTNQPDWGDVYIEIETDGTNAPDFKSLAKYIVSHREVSHFHEEICEMVFTHLLEAYDPSRLMVACLYTRRGGLDINPIRATHREMIPGMFTDVNYRNKKTLRQ